VTEASIGFDRIAQLVGGIVIFLYGLHLASDNLKAIAGARLKILIKLLTGNRFLGIFAGITGTILVQSNTATAVILVGLCQAGVISVARSIGVMLGANLGSTVTVQVVAFDLYSYAMLLIVAGFLATLRLSSKQLRCFAITLAAFGGGITFYLDGSLGAFPLIVGLVLLVASFVPERKALGYAMMGFGLIFVGMKIIGLAMATLKENPAFIDVILRFQAYPILVILASFVFTVLTNSSTATLGTAIALAASGGATGTEILSPVASVSIVMGAHLGSCPMALLSSLGKGRIPRQVSFSHVFIKIAGVVVVYPFLSHFTELLSWCNAGLNASAARSVANTHTLFNFVNVLTLVPFTPQIAKLLDRLLPQQDREPQGILQHIDDEQMEYHPLAIDSAELEIKRLTFKVRSLVREMESVLSAESRQQLRGLESADDDIDELFGSIMNFMTRLGQEQLSRESIQRIMTLVYVLTHLEGIGNFISKDFHRVQQLRIESNVHFSIEGIKLLVELLQILLDRMDCIITLLGERDFTQIRQILDGRREFHARTRTLTRAHFNQLVRGVHAAEETSMCYLDTLAVIKNIHGAIVDIAQNVRYCPYYSQFQGSEEDHK